MEFSDNGKLLINPSKIDFDSSIIRQKDGITCYSDGRIKYKSQVWQASKIGPISAACVLDSTLFWSSLDWIGTDKTLLIQIESTIYDMVCFNE
jgi:hypothetical protein